MKDFRANPKKFLRIKLHLSKLVQTVISREDRSRWCNADDFGFTRDVNQGIVEAHRERHPDRHHADGHRRCAFDDAVRLARETSGARYRVHLVLVGEPPFPPTVAAADARLSPWTHSHLRRTARAGPAHSRCRPAARRIWIRTSTRTCCRRCSTPSRGFPRNSEFPGCAARSIFRSAGRRRSWQSGQSSRALGLLRGRFARVLSQHGCRSTDHFAGFQITGRYDAAELGAADSRAAGRLDRIHVPSRHLRRRTPRRSHPLEGKPRAGIARADVAGSPRRARRSRRRTRQLPRTSKQCCSK